MLSDDLQKTLKQAYAMARGKRHEYITVEHLLQALTDDTDTVKVLMACQVDSVQLWKELEEIIGHTVQVMSDVDLRETQPALDFDRVLQRAIKSMRADGRSEVLGPDVLISIFGEPNSHAVYCLSGLGLSRKDVIEFVRHGRGKEAPPEAPQADARPTDIGRLVERIRALEKRVKALERAGPGRKT